MSTFSHRQKIDIISNNRTQSRAAEAFTIAVRSCCEFGKNAVLSFKDKVDEKDGLLVAQILVQHERFTALTPVFINADQIKRIAATYPDVDHDNVKVLNKALDKLESLVLAA